MPLLIVWENNFYAQSTFQKDNLSGDILKRAEAFSIKTFESDTWDVDKLLDSAADSIEYVRKNREPVFHLVNTFRLNAHSKSDDDRAAEEINKYREKDFLVKFSQEDPLVYAEYLNEINGKIEVSIQGILEKEELSLSDYLGETRVAGRETSWSPLVSMKDRQVALINKFFDETLKKNKKAVFIGEDVKSPYGGAFKIAKGLSDKYPDQVFTTPISEAAITGIGNGLALSGFKPFVEIMFGDFVTLALDQIINHASKVYHMYNRKIKCPIVIRTPMGGRRGYGPTHSQTLDRFLIGIDNVKTIALNTLINPEIIYNEILNETDPVIVIENKSDYGKYIGPYEIDNYSFMFNNEAYPVIRITPLFSKPNLTIVTYGGMAGEVIDSLPGLFEESDFKAEVLILTKINPIDYTEIIKSVEVTGKLVVIEEGSTIGGVSSEIISSVVGQVSFHIECHKIGALAVPIPSVKSLENLVLPNKNSIINALKVI